MNEYYIPVDLSLDITESINFINSDLIEIGKDAARTRDGFTMVAVVNDYFLNTNKIVKDFLRPHNLTITACNFLLTLPNTKCKRIHIDTFPVGNDKHDIMDARLSFFSLSETPGQISWWDTDVEMIQTSNPVILSNGKIQNRSSLRSMWYINDVPWENIPQPTHTEITTNAAFVRTSIPHTVIQDNGLRIAISYPIKRLDTNSVYNTWDIIKHININ